MKAGHYATAVLFALALIPLLYVTAYYAWVEPMGAVSGPVLVVPRYAVGGDVAVKVFAPVHAIDRMLRPAHWRPTLQPDE